MVDAALGRVARHRSGAALLCRVAGFDAPRRTRDRLGRRSIDDDRASSSASATPRPAAAPAGARYVRRQEIRSGARAVAANWRRLVHVAGDACAAAASPSVPSNIERDEAGYAKEVAQLNAQNDPACDSDHRAGIMRDPSRKAICVQRPSTLRGDEHGNGIITPTAALARHTDADCYYGRYEFTYPDGSRSTAISCGRSATIRAPDPFKLPPHPIPFPLPLPGFDLPPDDTAAADREIRLPAMGRGTAAQRRNSDVSASR